MWFIRFLSLTLGFLADVGVDHCPITNSDDVPAFFVGVDGASRGLD
jgi:hypothetical protein